MSIAAVIDALRVLVETDPTVAHDTTLSEPQEFVEKTVYAWESAPEVLRNTESGPARHDQFEALIVYVHTQTDEEPRLERERSISLALSAKRDLYLQRIAANASGPTWAHIEGSAEFDYVRTLQLRGVGVRVSGYRYLT